MASFDWRKNIEDSLRWIDHKHRGRWNIFRFKGGKRKTTESIYGRFEYTKTYWWDLWKRANERLCSLQKMDQ